VEIRQAGGGDGKGAALQGGDAFAYQLFPAVEKAGGFGAAIESAAGNSLLIRFVGLPEVGGVAIRNGAFLAHPVDRRGSIEAAGEGDSDFFANGQGLKDIRHGCFLSW